MMLRTVRLTAIAVLGSVFLSEPSLPGNLYTRSLRVGVAELPTPNNPDEEAKITALIVNEFLPSLLEKSFSHQYNLLPIVTPIDSAQSVLQKSSDRIADIAVYPERQVFGNEQFLQVKVKDLRIEDQDRLPTKTFIIINDQKGTKGLEEAVRSATDRIANYIVGRSLPNSSRGGAEGLVQIWCIVPADSLGLSAQVTTADLTISLPWALTAAAIKGGMKGLNFIGLGHREYFYECRPAANSNSAGVQSSVTKAVNATYVLSGQLSTDPADSTPEYAYLRLFVDDRTVGRTYSLPPIKFMRIAEIQKAELSGGAPDGISQQILDFFLAAVKP
ncbi:hypothetical protein MBRA_03757 [Methylobacterium brachiatum]|nr:hypothetical protein MBRA_03757 [Methylobacterium brachiatum]